jgi:capsular polysaccharide export protein
MSDALLASDTPFYLMPLPLDWDFQNREHSAFSGMRELIGEVLASFARHAPAGSHLLVKSHPLENGLRRFDRVTRDTAQRLGVAERVHHLDGGSLTPLLARAKGYGDHQQLGKHRGNAGGMPGTRPGTSYLPD